MTSSEAPAIGLTHGGSEDTGHPHRGPESKSIVVPYGFWLFVLSDMVLFSALLILLMIVRPQGILGHREFVTFLTRRRRQLGTDQGTAAEGG